MATNPLIALQTQVPDVGQSIGNALTNINNFNTLRENQQTRGLRNLAALSEADQARLKSAQLIAGQVVPMVEAGDIQGASSALISRRDQKKKLGLSTEDEDEGINLLSSNPKLFIQRGKSILNFTSSLEQKKSKDAPGFSEANQLRSQFLGQTKDFATQSDALGRIVASAEDPSAAGDLSLIFAYMKILDPGSTVREGEFANAENSAGVEGKIRTLYNKVLSGERLNEDQRADFVDRSFRLYEGSKGGYDARVSSFSDIATRAGLDPNDIIQAQPDIFGGTYKETRDRLTKRKPKPTPSVKKDPPGPNASDEDLIRYYQQ